MSIQNIKDKMPEYAKDVKLNLGTVLTEDGAPGLNQKQIYGTALSCAYALKNKELIKAIATEAAQHLNDQDVFGAKAAATLMAMNNVYYRTIHLGKDEDVAKLPAKLRMNMMAQHGIEKRDFELFSLAISSLAGCEMCIKSHIHEVKKAGIEPLGIQSAIRIASVLNSAQHVLETIE